MADLNPATAQGSSNSMFSSLPALAWSSMALQGATSVAGGLFGWLQQRAQNRANMKMAEYQWQKNMEAWNMQNEYNSPTAQMERLKAAGLNPNLVYGNGADNTAGAPPQYNAPHIGSYQGFGSDFARLASSLQPVLQVEKMIEDISLQKNQKRLIQANALKTEQEADYLERSKEDRLEITSLAKKAANLAYELDNHPQYGNLKIREINYGLTAARKALVGQQTTLAQKETAIKEVMRKWYTACTENPILQDANYKKYAALTAQQKYEYGEKLLNEGLPLNASPSDIMLAEMFSKLGAGENSGTFGFLLRGLGTFLGKLLGL